MSQDGGRLYKHIKALNGNLMDLERLINDNEIELALHVVDLMYYHLSKIHDMLKKAKGVIKGG